MEFQNIQSIFPCAHMHVVILRPPVWKVADCYVLDDAQKTAVLSSRGMGKVLGLGESGGNKLAAFLGTKAMSNFVGPELRAKLEQPVKFQWGAGGLELPPTVVNAQVCPILNKCLLL